MAKINGTKGDDKNLLGTEANDVIKGLAGDDTITPDAGNDTIFNNGWVKTGVIKGTRISEDINASQYECIGKKAGQGVTINAGAGNDIINLADVETALTTGTEDQVNALMAVFETANWQQV